ncbi:MAG: electron transport complex subunit RsxB [Pseudomonadota bacterium]
MTLIEAIDTLLPQTQCGRCGHPGCKPYAQGIAEGEAINKCPPGGVESIAALAALLGVPPLPLDIERGPAPAQVAYIREAECIGCTKCIQACPVDAILGAAKMMHTVLVDECTGCDLCVAPCPVDCIEMRPLPASTAPMVGDLQLDAQTRTARSNKRNQARQRFDARNTRLQREAEGKAVERQARAARMAQAGPREDPLQAAIARIKAQKATAISLPGASTTDIAGLKAARSEVAMARARLNKSLKAFGSPPTVAQHGQLAELHDALAQAERRLSSLQASASAPVQVQTLPDAGALKRAKLQLVMRRAELNSARTAGAEPRRLVDLQAALEQAEQALHSAETASDRPAPDLVRTYKQPLDARLRDLKTELAYARAELSRLQRRPDMQAQARQAAEARLDAAQRALEAYDA